MVTILFKGSRYYQGSKMTKIKEWLKWHRALIWGVFTAFPIVWVTHPELQALLPAKIISCVAPIAGIVGFISEVVVQVNRK